MRAVDLMNTPIELEEAEQRIAAQELGALQVEVVELLQSGGRILAADLCSDSPWPTTDRSAMDGFAVAVPADAASGAVYTVVGEALAGRPFERELRDGEAIRIMTGAVVPGGSTQVVKVEDTSGFDGIDGDRSRVRVDVPAEWGANVRPRGSEIAARAVVLRRGARIGPAEIGVLAVLGELQVPVLRAPRVSIVATGDEVIDAALDPLPHQVRDSNSFALAAQCAARGARPARFGIVPDEPEALRTALAQAMQAEILITIGGVSKGTHDLVHGTLAALGVREVFHGVKLRPGKPTFFGVREARGLTTFVFGLPGNPASTFATFELFVAPLISRMLMQQSATVGAQLIGDPPRPDPRTQAIPARLSRSAEGVLCVTLAPMRPSGDPFGLCGADALALVPARQTPQPGARLRVIPLGGDSSS